MKPHLTAKIFLCNEANYPGAVWLRKSRSHGMVSPPKLSVEADPSLRGAKGTQHNIPISVFIRANAEVTQSSGFNS